MTAQRRAIVIVAALAVALSFTATPAGAVVEEPDPTTVQILGINDFHGRILPDSFSGNAGAAVLAGAVDQLETEYPNTVFAAAGDLIGASTFESFVADDKPTIDALNAMGLDVSAVGNHEFDKGFADLTERVMAPYDPATNPYGGATWQYLGANVRYVDTGDPALPETWTVSYGDVEVGFIGAVTDETPSLVSPDGVAELAFEKEYVAANRSADALVAAGADLIVLLVHEGAPTTAYADAVDPSNDFGEMITNLSPDIDAVISGHTHLAYDHRVPVAEWAAEGRAVTERPVVSAGQYGMALNKLLFTVDADGNVTGLDTSVIDLYEAFPTNAEVQAIVDDAVAEADVLGSVVLGQIEEPLYRARTATGAPGSSRGGESTLGNAVANIQLWATEELGAQIALMNPGGLRADMLGTAAGDPALYPSDITFAQAASVQPFANTLVTMDLTGAQLAQVLEEQWQPEGSSRPFLRLGTSTGFTYTYDPAAAAGSRILEMRLDGEPIADDQVVKVVVNSFLAAGGDNFATLAEGTNRADSGRVDLTAQVEYLEANGVLPADFSQHAVGVSGLEDLTFTQGDEVTFDLSSLMMTGPTDPVDQTVTVALGGKTVGTFDVTNELPTDVYDEHGTASVAFTVPKSVKGDTTLTITGDTTGTVVTFDVTVEKKSNPGNGHGPGNGNGHGGGHGNGHGWGHWFGHGWGNGFTPYYPGGGWNWRFPVWFGGFFGFGFGR
nr:bifunctional UDP-sugar hydrolase/5'-nucleotidase [Demequina sp. TTPB684]